jgi:hypothetical protein
LEARIEPQKSISYHPSIKKRRDDYISKSINNRYSSQGKSMNNRESAQDNTDSILSDENSKDVLDEDDINQVSSEFMQQLNPDVSSSSSLSATATASSSDFKPIESELDLVSMTSDLDPKIENVAVINAEKPIVVSLNDDSVANSSSYDDKSKLNKKKPVAEWIDNSYKHVMEPPKEPKNKLLKIANKLLNQSEEEDNPFENEIIQPKTIAQQLKDELESHGYTDYLTKGGVFKMNLSKDILNKINRKHYQAIGNKVSDDKTLLKYLQKY